MRLIIPLLAAMIVGCASQPGPRQPESILVVPRAQMSEEEFMYRYYQLLDQLHGCPDNQVPLIEPSEDEVEPAPYEVPDAIYIPKEVLI